MKELVIDNGVVIDDAVLDWGNERKLLYHAEQDILKMCVEMYDNGHTPTDKQIKVVMKAREKLIKEGMPLDLQKGVK